MAWTKEAIRDLLMERNDAVERAIVALYLRQTRDEQIAAETRVHNGVGFSAFDAGRGTYYAEWVLSGRRLTGRHLESARRMAGKYLDQLCEIAAGRQAQISN